LNYQTKFWKVDYGSVMFFVAYYEVHWKWYLKPGTLNMIFANGIPDFFRFNYKYKLNLFRMYYEATKAQKFA
jgi:hypothetical protein